MKQLKFLQIIAACLFLSTNCNKIEKQEEEVIKLEEEVEVYLNVIEPEIKTKANVETDIDTMWFYVFDDKGRLESSFSRNYDDKSPICLKLGDKEIYIVCNLSSYDELNKCGDVASFENHIVSFSKFSGYLPLLGRSQMNIATSSYHKNFNVKLEHMVSRVCLLGVKNNLRNELEGESLRLEYAYLSNVVLGTSIGGSMPFLWGNKYGKIEDESRLEYVLGNESNFKYICHHLDTILSYKGEYNDSTLFYCFANATEVDNKDIGEDGKFTARFTRLVIVATIKGKRYYYPINLKVSKRNLSLGVHLIISHLGSLDPESFSFVQSFDPVIEDSQAGQDQIIDL